MEGFSAMMMPACISASIRSANANQSKYMCWEQFRNRLQEPAGSEPASHCQSQPGNVRNEVSAGASAIWKLIPAPRLCQAKPVPKKVKGFDSANK